MLRSAFLFTFLAACQVYGQQPTESARSSTTSHDIHIESFRSWTDLADDLSSRYGIPVTFEDGRVECAADLAQPSEMVRHAARLGFNHAIPSLAVKPQILNGSITERIIDGVATALDLEGSLSQMVITYNETGQPGRFTFLRQSNYLSIVPTEIRNKQGAWAAAENPFQRRISVAMQGSGDKLLNEIVRQANQQGGSRIALVSAPTSYLASITVDQPLIIQGETVRGALMRLSQLLSTAYGSSNLGGDLVWRSLWEPQTAKFYVSIGLVQAHGPIVAFKEQLQPQINLANQERQNRFSREKTGATPVYTAPQLAPASPRSGSRVRTVIKPPAEPLPPAPVVNK